MVEKLAKEAVVNGISVQDMALPLSDLKSFPKRKILEENKQLVTKYNKGQGKLTSWCNSKSAVRHLDSKKVTTSSAVTVVVRDLHTSPNPMASPCLRLGIPLDTFTQLTSCPHNTKTTVTVNSYDSVVNHTYWLDMLEIRSGRNPHPSIPPCIVGQNQKAMALHFWGSSGYLTSMARCFPLSLRSVMSIPFSATQPVLLH
ncbi:hypothetical protein J6590_068560 [Homalodisca vitripennis]|nr:hypothetical protein J6590_068560 [Homalodisca vitripennis]